MSSSEDTSKAGTSGRATPAGTSSSRSARRRARELAMQGVYQWLVSGEDRGAIQAHMGTSAGFEKADQEHFDALLNGSIREIEHLHELLVPHLDRPASLLSPVEHAILMIGTYELLHHFEIPYRVVINEGVELAKTFGGTDGYKYVNGVLDKVASGLRAAEMEARRHGASARSGAGGGEGIGEGTGNTEDHTGAHNEVDTERGNQGANADPPIDPRSPS